MAGVSPGTALAGQYVAGRRTEEATRSREEDVDSHGEQMITAGSEPNLGTDWARRPTYGHLRPHTAARDKISKSG